jgi:hypothetical protein
MSSEFVLTRGEMDTVARLAARMVRQQLGQQRPADEDASHDDDDAGAGPPAAWTAAGGAAPYEPSGSFGYVAAPYGPSA